MTEERLSELCAALTEAADYAEGCWEEYLSTGLNRPPEAFARWRELAARDVRENTE
jgi:hypothetical protein